MISALRRIARLRLEQINLQRIRHPNFIDVIRHRGITTVIDVGANDGQYGCELRDAGYTGRIVSFEPIKSVFERLSRRAASDPKWEAINVALGDVAGSFPISVSNKDVFSSLKKPSEYLAAMSEGSHEARTEIVEVRRLDDLVRERPDLASNAYLKIDTQGFEMEVLLGAGDRLRDFDCVQAELALRTLYDGQHGWTSVVDWMAERGFGVCLAKENGVDWNKVRLLELDIVFERLPQLEVCA